MTAQQSWSSYTSVALPDKALDPVGAKSAEEEHRVWNEKGKLVAGLYDRRERVDAIAKVGSSTYKVDRGERAGIGVPKHGAPPLGRVPLHGMHGFKERH